MSRFATVTTLNVNDAIPKAWTDEAKNFHDYFTQAGANLAALGGSNTLTLTARFHLVTLAGGNNIDNITDASTAQAGQEVELMFQNQQTIRTVGNINTFTGSSYNASPNEVIKFKYDGAEWWLIPNKSLGWSSQFDVVNTLSLTAIFTQSVPAGLLGAMGALKFQIAADYFNNTGSTRTLLIQVAYGATTLWGDLGGAIAASTVHRGLYIDAVLSNENAPNAQILTGHASLSYPAAGSGAGYGGSNAGGVGDSNSWTFGGSSAEDSTAAKNLVISVQHSVANTLLEVKGTVHVQAVP